MKEEELKKLIEKYYNGESTEDEEKALRDYFRQDNIPEGMLTEKYIFGYYTASGEVPEPSIGFEERILAGIDASERKSGSPGVRSKLLPLLSAAAGFLILTGSYFFFIHKTEPDDTFSDPGIAYAETMKILLNISSQINQGKQSLKPVGRINKMKVKSFGSINKSAMLVQKNLKSLGYLRNSYETDLVQKKDK